MISIRISPLAMLQSFLISSPHGTTPAIMPTTFPFSLSATAVLPSTQLVPVPLLLTPAHPRGGDRPTPLTFHFSHLLAACACCFSLECPISSAALSCWSWYLRRNAFRCLRPRMGASAKKLFDRAYDNLRGGFCKKDVT